MAHQQPTDKEMGLLKVASKHKHTAQYLGVKAQKLENFLVHCLKKEMDEEKLWEFANTYTQWWKGDSEKLGVLTTIKPYTKKTGKKETYDAHYTENGEFLFPVDKTNPVPCSYRGYFRITQERFFVKQNPEALSLPDFFEPKPLAVPEPEPVAIPQPVAVAIPRRRIKKPIAKKHKKLVICMPTSYKPHLYAEVEDVKEWLDAEEKLSENLRPALFKEKYVIHPMFYEDDEHWKMANDIFESGKATTYSFAPLEKASQTYCVNTATIVQSREYQYEMGGCPHIFGDVFLVINEMDLPFAKSSLLTREKYERVVNGDEEEEEEEDD
jgi:hypothetical protein